MANPENKQIPYESTQKDIRDAIESVATAIGGIAIPSADHVSYDNSGSGLSATDVQDAIDELSSEKVDKEVGKGLSTNDYTDAEKAKLAGIEANAEVNVQSDWSQSDNTKDDYIKNKPSLAAVATSGSYNDLTDKPTIPDELADLAADSTHRVVTDSQISTWNGKQDDVNLSVVDGKVCITYTV